MTIALLAARIIQSQEGCKLTAYWDPNGKVWTIGYGHTRGVTQGMVITQKQAGDFIPEDSTPLVELVKDRRMIEAAALTSFGYNCGIGALRRVLAGSIHIEHEEFMAGDDAYGETSGGVKLGGLVTRRGLEAALIEASRAT